jgi:hypothetical protein
MSPKFMMGVSLAWFIGQLMCLIMEGSYVGGEEMALVNYATNIAEVSSGGFLATSIAAAGFISELIARLILWDYSFFTGSYVIMQYFLFFTLTIGTVTAVLMYLRGTGT